MTVVTVTVVIVIAVIVIVLIAPVVNVIVVIVIVVIVIVVIVIVVIAIVVIVIVVVVIVVIATLVIATVVIVTVVEVTVVIVTVVIVTSESSITIIVIGSLYCKPGSKKKTALLDHIAEVYHILNSRYKKGLHWIIAGDFNELKIKSILDISPNFKQVVNQPTRFNPPAILDKIITTLHAYYQPPEIQPPLENDPDKNGKPSDHRIVSMSSISTINNQPAITNEKNYI